MNDVQVAREVQNCKQVLDIAYRLVAHGWTQNDLAVTETGLSVNPEHENAAQWCAQGAILRAAKEVFPDEPNIFDTSNEKQQAIDDAYRYLLESINFETLESSENISIAQWNDNECRTQNEVAFHLREARDQV